MDYNEFLERKKIRFYNGGFESDYVNEKRSNTNRYHCFEVIMNCKQIERIEIETGCKAIEFDNVDGLYVFFNPKIKHGLTIAGISGDAFFDAGMAKRLPDMLKDYLNVRKFELKGKHGSTILSGKQAIALVDGLADIVETYLEKTV